MAVATLVNTRGTTPRKEGAKMVVGEGGRILGLGHDRRLRGRAGHRGIGRRAGPERAAAPRAEPGRRGGVGDRAHLRRHHRGLRGAGDARPARSVRSPSTRRRARTPRAGGRAAVLTRLDAPENGAKLLLLDTRHPRGLAGRSVPGRAVRRRGGRGASRRASPGRSSSRACVSSPRSSRRPRSC